MAAADITVLLTRLQGGDRSALDELSPLVYEELHRLASGYMRQERADHTLQPTALLHEAWMRLAGSSHPDYRNRAHFFAIAAQLMRQILVDYARRRRADKRGGQLNRVDLESVLEFHPDRAAAVAALDDALRGLSEKDARKAHLVEMRFFGGLTLEEMAQAEDCTVAIVRRELRLAQAWLNRELGA